MPNTTNNNWPTPADTDLVKNGADAIRDLGNAIDTTLGVYAESGLVLLNTTSFTGVSSFSLPANIFSATYENYKILMKMTSTGNNDLCLRVRAAGTDLTSGTYYSNGKNMANTDGTLVSGSNNAAATFILVGETTDDNSVLDVQLFSPFLTRTTYAIGTHTNRRTTPRSYYRDFGGLVNNTTSYDSASFVALTGTMTGTYSVYGFNI
jgi:hypothetical protein